jgi:replication initiation protein RepC
MGSYQPRTAFGLRPLALADLATQQAAAAATHASIAEKWAVYRDICTARERLGLTERSLALLNALLSFHPDATLSADKLIVWPSNAALQARAHGMAPATLRRHLGRLVESGLVIRRDSPNGKRYARRGEDGDVTQAFGFDLAPLRQRAPEFASLASSVRAEEWARAAARETLSLLRRDILKMIQTARMHRLDIIADKAEMDFAGLLPARLRPLSGEVLTTLADEARNILGQLESSLSALLQSQEMIANDSHCEQHKQNSKTETIIDLEPAAKMARRSVQAQSEPMEVAAGVASREVFPLNFVLSICPTLSDYARQPIVQWRDLVDTVAFVRPMLGVSLSAWEEACATMGDQQASVVLAAILERMGAIANAGAYLRALTRKASAGQFSSGPMLMALVASRRSVSGGKNPAPAA